MKEHISHGQRTICSCLIGMIHTTVLTEMMKLIWNVCTDILSFTGADVICIYIVYRRHSAIINCL